MVPPSSCFLFAALLLLLLHARNPHDGGWIGGHHGAHAFAPVPTTRIKKQVRPLQRNVSVMLNNPDFQAKERRELPRLWAKTPDREQLPLNYDDPATVLLLLLGLSEPTLFVLVTIASFFKAISSIHPLDAFVTVALCHAAIYRPYVSNLLTSAPDLDPTPAKELTEDTSALERILAYAMRGLLLRYLLLCSLSAEVSHFGREG